MYSVSVIIPIYNVEKYIERCVRSLFDQTLQSIEYIFIDDCSPDNSLHILKRIIKEYPNRENDIRIITHKKNKGLASARNTGLSSATGEYIIHCDSDDWVNINAYRIMYEKAKSTNSDIIICGFNNIYHKKTKQILPRNYSTVEEILRDSLSGGLHNSVCNKLIKRDIYINKNIKWIDGIDMLEDSSIIPRLINNSSKIEIIKQCLYNYNLCNEGSYTNEWKNKSLTDIIFVTDFLVDYFSKEQSIKNINLDNECNYLKLQARLLLLLHSNGILRKQFYSKYIVELKYIWHHPNMNICYKILLHISLYSYKTMSAFIVLLNLLKTIKRKFLL